MIAAATSRLAGILLALTLALSVAAPAPAGAQFRLDLDPATGAQLPPKPAAPKPALPSGPDLPNEPFSTADLLNGTTVGRDACAARANTVFVQSMGQGFCVAYYLSGAEAGRVPTVYMPGDSLAPTGVTGKARVLDGYLGQTPKLLIDAGRVWVGRLGTPVIFLGRMGMHGTSGWHANRHSLMEVEIASRALDAIAARHGFRGYHLVGQSGGGLIIAGLLARRADIDCAVVASAPLDLRGFYRMNRILYRTTGPIANFDPLSEAGQVARRARVFAVTDPADTVAPAATQTPWVPALARAGVPATQILTPARDPKHHAIVEKSFFIARDCIAGRPAPDIKRRFEALGPTQFGE